jgi:NADH-ubiquinone oxidoreductase chain 5
MVTAGIVVLIRSSPILEYSSNILLVISFLGALTAFFAGSIGSFQNDLKKVIAYSTCSQLGYMVFACGISNYSSSLFHLFNHAFFKALLFLGAGSIIHSVLDEQDMRKMGGLHKLLPLAYISLFIASFALIGLPAMSGFYSKDIILEVGFSKYIFIQFFLY